VEALTKIQGGYSQQRVQEEAQGQPPCGLDLRKHCSIKFDISN